MALTPTERDVLRDLAKQVAEIAAHPRHAAQREMWKRHNALRPGKPMVLVFPEGAWSELLPDDTLVVSDPFFRRWEWHLRHLIYRWHHLRDDNVITPVIKVPAVRSHTGWGLEPKTVPSSEQRGAFGFDPPIKQPDDAARLQAPRLCTDPDQTRRNHKALAGVIGDILQVTVQRRLPINASLIGTLMYLRGPNQIMLDMCDRPQWLHQVMSFMTDSVQRLLDEVERDGLDLNNGDDYVGSGGVAYTDELPAPGFDGERVRLRDLWGFADAQEIADVSPRMHEEFVLQYQRRLLDRFGLNCYGCCESLDGKFEIVKQVPRLRRISISPWTDLRLAAQELQDRYVFSWKPNPAEMVGRGVFDPDGVRAQIREMLEITRGCVIEMILKDTHTVRHQPERLTTWVEIASDLAARYA
jgi:hypothetical protein